MSETIESTIEAIYNRIAPKIKISNLSANVDFAKLSDGFEHVSGIQIATQDYRLNVSLSLYNDDADENINNYRWEYMDCVTGALIESELDYSATDEEVIAFFQHALATDESVVKL